MKKILLTSALVLFSVIANAQYGYRDSNMIGISVGVNQFTLNTNDLDTKPGIDISGGLSVRGNFYNDFDMVYEMRFSENTFSVKTLNQAAIPQDTKFKLPAVQIALLLSYKFIEDHLSMELGPMFQVNGKLSLDSDEENNTVAGTTLQAKDLKTVSQFNFYPTVGITGGDRFIRANVMYQYGLTNILSKVDTGTSGKLTGHAGILTGSVVVYF